MKRHKGLTLVEVLVALAILALIGPVLAGFISHLQVNTRAEIRSQAVTLAQERLEQLRLVNPQTLPNSGCEDQTQSRGGRTYTVRTCYCLNAGFCGPGARHLAVRVFLSGETAPVYQVETVYTQLR
ncbi:type IV pilus modification PilV family protein [Thermus igniterrae]|uniref:type IV pilus modification PilV family protein n=1 Tax=Thermus igniterrae TaxID=88189 RepID=UPI0009FC8AB5|nr:type II secretion system protein [Thermus igniterrae]